MLQLNTLVRFIHSHSPARLSKFKKILARRPKSVPTPALDLSESLRFLILLQFLQCAFFHLRYEIDNQNVNCCVVCLVASLRLHFVFLESKTN